MPYYAVVNGRNPGVYNNWDDCQEQVHRYSNSFYRRFETKREAWDWYNECNESSDDSDDDSDYDDYIDVYVDGACSNNGYGNARAGIGVWFGRNHPLNVSTRLHGRQTNNRAEIHAAIEAIKQAQDDGISRLRINTDSEFLKKSVELWMPRWKDNGWTTYNGGPVKNEEDFLELDDLMDSMDVIWNFVPSHSGVYGNEMADKLARRGASQHY